MIATVTFNPSLDYIVNVEDFQTGTVNRTDRELIYPGGKGINVSIVLKNLGYENTAWGFWAGFTGKEIIRLLKEKGVNTDFIPVELGNSRINVKLRSKQETEINGQGPVITQKDIRTLYDKIDTLQSGDVLVLAGSVPDRIPQTVYMDIMKQLEHRGISIVVDATRKLLVNVLQYHPFLIKPNHHELGDIFEKKLTTREEVVPYAKKLQEMGAKNVLVSMAGSGAVLVTEENRVYLAEAPRGKVVNSVGAGDSMVAGFLAGYLETKDYGEALLQGLCTGSASAFSEELATKQEVEELRRKSVRLGEKVNEGGICRIRFVDGSGEGPGGF